MVSKSLLAGFACLVSAISLSRPSLAEEAVNLDLIEATFVVRYGEEISSDTYNSFRFKNDFNDLGGKELEQVDFPETGVSFLTGKFTKEQLKELESRGGVEATLPITVSLFEGATCGKPSEIEPDAVRAVPEHVCRVVGNRPNDDFASGPAVWILDSGIDSDAAGKFLNVVSQIDCSRGASCTGAIAEDNIGHGTMVAGTVGGATLYESATNKYLGVAGVSPKTRLHIVRVFQKDRENIFRGPVNALRHLVTKLSTNDMKAGDIVNISWGGRWLNSVRKRKNVAPLEEIDKILAYIADRQVRIVVAAGNASEDDIWPWVQEFFPANSAPYQSPIHYNTAYPRGGIFSVSATDSRNLTMSTWVDNLWPSSAFAASYAEPGVDVLSLWHSTKKGLLQQNFCSGTSFAAPALAGLMVQVDRPLTVPTADSPYVSNDLVGYKSPGQSTNPNTDHPGCS